MPTRTATLAQITTILDAGRSVYAQPFTFSYTAIPANAKNITCTLSGKLHPGYYTTMSYSNYFYLQQVPGGTRLLDYSSGIGTSDTPFNVTSGISIQPGDSSTTFYYSWQANSRGRTFIQIQDLTLTISWDEGYSITTAVSPSGTGTLTANKTSGVAAGETITLIPTPATGYQLGSWTVNPSSVSISGNKLTMPASNVTVTANFTKVNYTITKSASPSGGGTVNSNVNSAAAGTTITLSNTPASGFVFDHYTVNGSAISGNTFSMPAKNTAVIGYFTKLTTGTIASKDLTPGTNTLVTLTQSDTSLTHQIVITFGSLTKTISVAAGVRTVNIQPDAAWCNSIPNASSMSGGTVVVKTLKGGTVIGQTTIATGCVFYVPTTTGFYPTMTVTNYVLHTVAEHTYPSVGNIFVQGKTGLQCVLSNCAGAYGSTVVRTEIWLVGYTGEDYTKTGTGAMTLNTGLLTNAGTLQVKAKITDSRGRAMTYTNTYTVYAYAEPSGTLSVYRCTENGTPSDDGLYARYEYECSYSAVGSNTMTRKLSIDGHTLTLNANTGNGWVLGNTHYQYPILEAHDLYLTLEDVFTTKSVSVTIPSQRFLIHFSADGTSVAVGQSATTGSNRFTIAQGMTMYIGSRSLEQYIHDVVGI